MNDPCRWCDHPETGHGTRYASWIGDHEWTPRPDNTARAVADIDRALAITAGRLAETTQAPAAVRHPEGGLTVEWVADTPSDRLPPRKAWPVAPPVPRFRTGRVQPDPARENPAPQREPGGAIGLGSSPAPTSPVCTTGKPEASDSPPVLARPSTGFPDDRVSALPEVNRTPTDRPGVLRRILNATKRSST